MFPPYMAIFLLSLGRLDSNRVVICIKEKLQRESYYERSEIIFYAAVKDKEILSSFVAGHPYLTVSLIPVC